jgi:predicted ATP-dependent endonuclease of OLD family
MKVSIKNLGPIDSCEFSLGNLSIICGENNTGKTYITYAIFCFLDFWNKEYFIPIEDSIKNELFSKGSSIIDLHKYVKSANDILKKASKVFSQDRILSKVFAADPDKFSNTSFSIEIDTNLLKISEPKKTPYEYSFGTKSKAYLNIVHKENELHLKLLIEKKEEQSPYLWDLISSPIQNIIKQIIFSKVLPSPFISSAERTGAAIFQKELDFSTSRIVEILRDKEKTEKFQPFDFLRTYSAKYPIPVRRGVDFIRRLSDIEKNKSFIAESHPEILKKFTDITGGSYKLEKKSAEVYYIPTSGKKQKLTLAETSSCARSLLDLSYYLRHVAEEGDMLIIDEPEMNLHPENQRKLARLLSSLVNIGLKIYMTTHSDYIVKELSTLIVLKQESRRIKNIAKEEKYSDDELLFSNKVSVYTTIQCKGRKSSFSRCGITLDKAEISQEKGITFSNFDDTIEEMNRIQNRILWED